MAANTAANALASCRFHASTNRSITAVIAGLVCFAFRLTSRGQGNTARAIVRLVEVCR